MAFPAVEKQESLAPDYFQSVSSFMRSDPAFKFLSALPSAVNGFQVRTVVLEFRSEGVTTVPLLDVPSLHEYWLKIATTTTDCHRLYILEDLSRDHVEAFGSKFDIDPALFLNYGYAPTDYRAGNSWNPTLMRALPSVQHGRSTYTLKYHEIREFQTEPPKIQQYRIRTKANVGRKILTIPKQHGGFGLVRRNCSFWSQEEKDSSCWNGTFVASYSMTQPTDIY